jgi:hypothetical protein
MPAGAVWTSAEEAALVDYLVDNRAEAGDGGSFKIPTFQQALPHLTHLHKSGPIKTAKICKNKYNVVCFLAFLVVRWLINNLVVPQTVSHHSCDPVCFWLGVGR